MSLRRDGAATAPRQRRGRPPGFVGRRVREAPPHPASSSGSRPEAGSPERTSDNDLFARIAEGSGAAFAELYGRYVQELYDFAARLTHDRAAAADIVQSVFATVWERARRGEEVRSPRAWLYTATRNAAIDEIRRRRHTTFAHHEEAFDFAAVDGARSPEPVHALIDKDLAELVWSTAAALTPDEYALLDLHVRHDLAPAELADELGITTGAVHTRLSRLRRSFEEALTVKLLTRRDDCEQLADLVSTLGERADSPDGQRLLRAHIRDCSTCKESRRRYVTATEVLASLAPVPLMPGVPDAIWSSLVALLGLERGAAAGGTAAAPRGRVSIAARARAKPFAAGALVLAALGLLGLGLWAGSRTLLPDRSAGAVHDPSGFWSPSHQIGRRSTTNRVTVAWARQPDAVAYSVLWSHAPREEPDTVTDLPGTATRTTSPAVAPGRWYFHLRTEGRKDDWTDTVHLGPFVIASPRDQVPTRPAADAKKDGAAGKASGAGATVAGTTTTDSMPPQGQNVALAGGRYYRTLAVSLVLSPGTDAESGIDAASGIVERQAGLLVGGRCAGWGSWQRVVLDRSTDTDVAGGRCYRYRYRISDRAGNRSPFSRPSAVAAVDTTPPERPTLSLTEDGPATITVGTRLIYRPTGGGGTFVVAATTSDAGSGLAALKFPALADGMAATTTTRRTEAPYEMAYTWRGGAVEGGTKTVTAFDRAGNTARATFTITADQTGPKGLSVAVSGGPWFTVASVPLVVEPGVDSGSGVDRRSLAVERDVAPLSAGECGAFAGAWKTVALRGDADTTVESGSCYRYRVVVLDNVGNRSTSSPSEAARIDTTPPTPPKLALRRESGTVYVSGSTVFYRPGAAGSFSVEATANDPESGIAYVSFPPVAGATGGGADGSPPYESSYSWGSTLSVAGSRRVLVSNRAGAGAHADFTLAPDAVPPAELRVKVSGGPWFTVASVPLVVEPGVDGGSGVDRRSLAVERDVAPLSAGECGAFAGAWKTVALRGDADTTVESGSCYRYRVVVLDNVGNRSTSSPSEVARIDTTPPTPPKLAMKAPSGAVALSETIVYYGAAAGSFSVEAKANDPESGIAYVWFPPVAGATGGGADATSPYESGYGWIDPLATTGLQRVIASNGAGLTDAGAFTLAADFDAPTGMSIILLAGPIYKGDAVPFRIVEGTDAGSGVRKGSATVERDSALLGADGVCGPYAGSWTILPVPGVGGGADTTVERGRCYRYRVTVSDNVGNTATSAPTGDAIVP